MDQLLQHASANPGFIATVLAAILGLFVAGFTVRRTALINLRNKRVDVAIHCNTRYDQTHAEKIRIKSKKATRQEAYAYYARFWGLKSDQFDYWLADVVDIETFSNWCFMTMKSFSEEPSEQDAAEFGFRWGWLSVGAPDHEVANPWFHELTQALSELGRLWHLHGGTDTNNLKKELAVRQLLLLELLDVLQIIHSRSAYYRRRILFGMTIQQYRRTLVKQKRLGLSVSHRSSKIEHRLVNWQGVDA